MHHLLAATFLAGGRSGAAKREPPAAWLVRHAHRPCRCQRGQL